MKKKILIAAPLMLGSSLFADELKFNAKILDFAMKAQILRDVCNPTENEFCVTRSVKADAQDEFNVTIDGQSVVFTLLPAPGGEKNGNEILLRSKYKDEFHDGYHKPLNLDVTMDKDTKEFFYLYRELRVKNFSIARKNITQFTSQEGRKILAIPFYYEVIYQYGKNITVGGPSTLQVISYITVDKENLMESPLIGTAASESAFWNDKSETLEMDSLSNAWRTTVGMWDSDTKRLLEQLVEPWVLAALKAGKIPLNAVSELSSATLK